MQKRENTKSGHEHIIGMLNHVEYGQLVTVEDMKKHIQNGRDFNEFVQSEINRAGFNDAPGWHRRYVYSLAEYGDRRYSTDLTRFAHCPECGAAINWGAIKTMKF